MFIHIQPFYEGLLRTLSEDMFIKCIYSTKITRDTGQTFHFLFLMTQRRPFIRERTIETRICRNSRPEVFCKKGVLRNFVKFTEKQLCQSLFFNKVTGLRPVTLLKKRLWRRCFSVNFAKFLRTHFLQNTCEMIKQN